MPIQLTETEKKIITDVLKKNLKDILFGSMVTGKVRPKSDIDIAVKAKEPLNKAVWAKIEEDFDQSELSREVDVVDYMRLNPEFQKVIDEGGEKILATKSHPYRLCPTGYHWVRTHLREVPPSLRNPSGSLTEVDGHCRVNRGFPSTKIAREVLTADEITEMFKRFGKGAGHNLLKFRALNKKSWNKLDDEISFWTEFWNDVFDPKEKLDPNMVKALIGSESSFKLDPGKPYAGKAGRAHGLIQLTDEALAVLSGERKELKDYFIRLNHADLKDPNVSLAVGVRWLFHKKYLASEALKHDANWEEALIAYKGYLRDYRKNPAKKFDGLDRYKELNAELHSDSH